MTYLIIAVVALWLGAIAGFTAAAMCHVAKLSDECSFTGEKP
jgi:hypothetical protein